MKVYQCINAVQAALAKIGIAKNQRNAQQQYNFRGIDGVYNALAPLLAEHGLCILPEVTNRVMTERVTQKGGTLFYAVLTVAFDFVAAEDGSKHRIVTIGEAMDSGDKATNKAMSAAYKYACLQAFCIPTEGESPDADAVTHSDIKPDTESLSNYAGPGQPGYIPTFRSPYGDLVDLIKTKKLEDKVEGWCNHFKVISLASLSDTDLQKLINKIQESN
ncbi:MAG: ERF family protein [Candidatus Andersenbacteria bacterium]